MCFEDSYKLEFYSCLDFEKQSFHLYLAVRSLFFEGRYKGCNEVIRISVAKKMRLPE